MPIEKYSVTRNEEGISLIEVLLAVGLLFIVVTALIKLGTTTLNTSDASRSRAVAQQLADEALDLARYNRDIDPGEFFSSDFGGNYRIEGDGFVSSGCDPTVESLMSNSCLVTVSVSGVDVSFYRVVTFKNDATTYCNTDVDCKEVVVTVMWDNRGTFSNVTTSTVLTRWRN